MKTSMHPEESGSPVDPLETTIETTEEMLLRQNRDLQRQIHELKSSMHTGAHASGAPARYWRPSAITIWAIFLGLTVVTVVAFFAGYLPLESRRAVIAGEARQEQQALPRVEVIQVGRSTAQSELELPGNIQPIMEAPILARADGYIIRRLVDIGDRVKAGQEVAEIDAPELEQQVVQAKATVQQMQAAMELAQANVLQGKADLELARVTAQRSGNLRVKGVVSKQEDDQNQAAYQAKLANLQALEKAIMVQNSNMAAAQANQSRLENLQSYRVVRAPFDGVITQRNVDTGALVNAGSTLLYRVAQTATLRTYVNMPQAYSDSVHTGQLASLSVANLPGRKFPGRVARTSNSLDPNSRTLLVEIQVPNPENVLMPGMYARVDLSSARNEPPLLIPSEALMLRAEGAQIASVGPDHKVHLQKVEVGRDYGDRLEVLGGISEGATVILNPGDAVQEGQKVDPVAAAEKPRK